MRSLSTYEITATTDSTGDWRDFTELQEFGKTNEMILFYGYECDAAILYEEACAMKMPDERVTLTLITEDNHQIVLREMDADND
jgi:hypothetical protein